MIGSLSSVANCSREIVIFHNSFDPTGSEYIGETTLARFSNHSIPFIDFHGIYKNFSVSTTAGERGEREVEDTSSFKYLQTQILLNALCDVDPHQSMLFGSRVGSFLLRYSPLPSFSPPLSSPMIPNFYYLPPLRHKSHFSDGDLIKGSASKEILLYQNGSLHAIPNWDTFLSLKFDMKMVKTIRMEELEELPLGDPLPMCTNC